MTKREKILIGLFLVVAILIFMLGRFSKQTIVEPQKPDYSKYEKRVDSLLLTINKRDDSIKVAYSMIDSLKKIKVINNKKVKHDIEKIKRFTYTSRHRFNDSLLRANGLK